MNVPKTMDSHDWSLLILLSVLWGGAYFFAGVAVKELPPLTVVLARVSIAAIVLLPVFWYLGHSLPKTVRHQNEWAG
jgi:drug/metabolite transporter (DMT)-like permease